MANIPQVSDRSVTDRDFCAGPGTLVQSRVIWITREMITLSGPAIGRSSQEMIQDGSVTGSHKCPSPTGRRVAIPPRASPAAESIRDPPRRCWIVLGVKPDLLPNVVQRFARPARLMLCPLDSLLLR